MDGKTHLAVGLGTGCVAGAVALQTQGASTFGGAAVVAALWGACSQFPDLDTASRPQRWFYRGLAALLVLWALGGHWQAAAIAGMLALLPLLHHHRGWTHRWWAAPLAPLAVLLLWRRFTADADAWAWEDPASSARSVVDLVSRDLPAYLAMVGGYATHLIVDRFRARRR
jgi:membrane-bound metal-dependent hydrolase YbcI (DUF457 family)